MGCQNSDNPLKPTPQLADVGNMNNTQDRMWDTIAYRVLLVIDEQQRHEARQALARALPSSEAEALCSNGNDPRVESTTHERGQHGAD